MSGWAGVCTLIATVSERDDLGVSHKKERRRRVPCNVYGISQTAYYTAAQAGVKPPGGVADAKAHDDSDGRVRLAIKVYVKANFGMDNPDAERFMKTFETMLTSMSGDSAYNGGDAA